ncbi:Hsp20/alpha crystallin family protein [Geomesophilobacter sediminis]|uniref:Hsp20/alpha crystallin family protein n=1 Tax=Geomesophilobacter sediminis TaxID=2798584 RepID=A0A8J7SBM6_9BACT|nr:Hsp20/alpha crystallin family protein [Geomesophilobacter sediminis]MBJ6727881.1 Hsp20/alpha crystallin family protein [Geomesophilobacter sediminis]
MAVIPKEPLEWLTLFRQQMDEIFRFLSSLEGREGFAAEKESAPLVDIYETAAGFVVEAELPGCLEADISLSICCSTLVIEGIKKEEPRSGVNYICLERRFGRFCRAVEIPPSVDLDKVKARYHKGLLTVHLPWLENRRRHIRKIPIEQ